MLHYPIHIWWSEIDGAFLARIPDLRYCIADGPTPEAAVTAVLEVAELWLKTAREKGWPIPEPSLYREEELAA